MGYEDYCLQNLKVDGWPMTDSESTQMMVRVILSPSPDDNNYSLDAWYLLSDLTV